MKTFFDSTFEHLLLRITNCFRYNTAQKWIDLALGWVLQAGRKTIAGMIRAVGEFKQRKWSAYYKFFQTNSWQPKKFWQLYQEIVFSIIGELQVIALIDDTIIPKIGRKIAYTDWYREFQGQTARDSKAVYGHKLVVLAVLWEKPFGISGAMSIPIHAKVLTEGTTPLELGRKMVEETLEQLNDERSILVVGDRYFGGRPFLAPVIERLTGLVRLKRNNALYEIPGEYNGNGAPRKKGKRLPTPEEMAREEGLDWELIEVERYGEKQEVEVYTIQCLWYRLTGEVRGRLVIVRDPEEPGEWMALYSTDKDLTAKEMIKLYSYRWKIEELFREAKQHGGLGEAECRNPESVQRVLPFSMCLVGLVKIWFMSNYEELIRQIPRDEWEQQSEFPSFQIMLQKLRWQLRKKQLSQKMGSTPTLPKNIKKLLDQWTRAA